MQCACGKLAAARLSCHALVLVWLLYAADAWLCPVLHVQVRCEWRQCCWRVSAWQASGQVADEGHATAAEQNRQGGNFVEVVVLTLRGCAGNMLRVYSAGMHERSGGELTLCVVQL
jgi:hypothetical protein